MILANMDFSYSKLITAPIVLLSAATDLHFN